MFEPVCPFLILLLFSFICRYFSWRSRLRSVPFNADCRKSFEADYKSKPAVNFFSPWRRKGRAVWDNFTLGGDLCPPKCGWSEGILLVMSLSGPWKSSKQKMTNTYLAPQGSHHLIFALSTIKKSISKQAFMCGWCMFKKCIAEHVTYVHGSVILLWLPALFSQSKPGDAQFTPSRTTDSTCAFLLKTKTRALRWGLWFHEPQKCKLGLKMLVSSPYISEKEIRDARFIPSRTTDPGWRCSTPLLIQAGDLSFIPTRTTNPGWRYSFIPHLNQARDVLLLPTYTADQG